MILFRVCHSLHYAHSPWQYLSTDTVPLCASRGPPFVSQKAGYAGPVCSVILFATPHILHVSPQQSPAVGSCIIMASLAQSLCLNLPTEVIITLLRRKHYTHGVYQLFSSCKICWAMCCHYVAPHFRHVPPGCAHPTFPLPASRGV